MGDAAALTVVQREPREHMLGRFKLVPGRQLLLDGEPVALGAKPLNILSTLVAANGNLVTKDELIEQTWPGLVVEENALQAHISAIRKALGEDARWIVTVPGQGYRFSGPKPDQQPANVPPEPTVAPGSADPEIQVDKPRRQWSKLWIAIAAGLILLAAVAGWATWRAIRPTAPGAMRIDRYLVLPFVNRTGDPANENFVDSLSDSMAGRIAGQIWESEVVGHTKAFALKGQPVNETKLGEQLGLDYIVEGSLLPSASDIEVAATLIDAHDGTQIASVSAKAPKGEPETELQWLSSGLVDQLRWAVVRDVRRRIAAEGPKDKDIRNLVVRAETLQDEESLGAELKEAERLADMALAIAPHNVHVLCARASPRVQFVNAYGYADEAERTANLDIADAALAEAAQLEPNRAAIRLVLGDLRSAQGRHDAAHAEFQRVLDLDPLNAYALDGLAMEDIYLGQPEAALPKLERARALNPDDAYLIDGDVAVAELLLGHDEAALKAVRQAVTVDSGDPWVWVNLTGLLQLNGRTDEAHATLATLRRLNPGITIAKLRLADANTAPRFRQAQERLYAALKDAGLD
jgi:DNA-binding winged helix-turn-helix (wHTH) protein/TolB-like protein/Flp pilus assembly protein TadD